jgi:formylglycine-generating enzyme required for sulfatase activity
MSAEERIIRNLVSNMVYVSGGTFTMGATSEQGSDADNDEKPAHSVTLSSYYIGKYEVTQAEWKAVMGNNPSCTKGDDTPVENVSWDDCQTFIARLNKITGQDRSVYAYGGTMGVCRSWRKFQPWL